MKRYGIKSELHHRRNTLESFTFIQLFAEEEKELLVYYDINSNVTFAATAREGDMQRISCHYSTVNCVS